MNYNLPKSEDNRPLPCRRRRRKSQALEEIDDYHALPIGRGSCPDENFFGKLIQNIMLHKEQGEALVVLINDVNGNNRGRDNLKNLVEKLDGECVQVRSF